MAIADRHGRPIAVHVESATPHEVTLVSATLAERFVEQEPEPVGGELLLSPQSVEIIKFGDPGSGR